MRISFVFPVFVFLFAASSAFAQKEETIIGQRGWGLTGIWGGYNHQYTVFEKKNIYDRGGFFTFEFGKTLLVGWSNYGLSGNVTVNAEQRPFDMRWNTLNLGYNIASYKAVHPIVRMDVGGGIYNIRGVGEDRVFVVQPAAGIEFNVFRWFRVGAEGGYRFVTDAALNPLDSQQLSAPFGQLSLKFGYSWGRHHKQRSHTRERSKRSEG